MAVGLTACNEDFTDWAAPQSNAPVNQNNITAIIENGADTAIEKEQAADSVSLVKLVGFSDNAVVTSDSVTTLSVNGQFSVPFKNESGTLKVATEQLDSVVAVAENSLAHVERNLTLSVKVNVKTADNTSYSVSSNEVTVKYTPERTPAIESAYYLVGGFENCDWDITKGIPMEDKGNGVFKATVKCGNACYWKIFGQKAKDNSSWNDALGAMIDGDASTSGFVTWNKGTEVKAFQIADEGEYVITFDAVNYTYSVAPKQAALYFTGGYYNWNTWNALTPVIDHDGEFYTILYADENEEIKFAPQEGWGNDFAGTVASDAAGSGAATPNGNLQFGKAGWYLLWVNAQSQTVEVYTPTIYMYGACVGNTWEDKAENVFTIPDSRDGDFVSPAFTGDGAMRMCVHPKEVQWWQTEFAPVGGSITFRTGDELTTDEGHVGQRLHLNFAAGTGTLQ